MHGYLPHSQHVSTRIFAFAHFLTGHFEQPAKTVSVLQPKQTTGSVLFAGVTFLSSRGMSSHPGLSFLSEALLNADRMSHAPQ